MRKHTRLFYVSVCFCIMMLTGLCGCGKIDSDTQVVLTTGFAKDEIFKIEDLSCSTSEMMVYLTNIQNQYEGVYGEGIWDTEIDGVTLEENVKEVALAKMAQIKTITLLARKRGIELDDKEKARVEQATDKYYSSLNNDEITAMGITRETIYGLYEEYALSTKVYNDIIKDINPEISDDEARTITVQHILIRTYTMDDEGNKTPYDSSEKEKAKWLADEICERAKNGEEFEELAREYSEDDNITMSFGKGDVEQAFETAAFNLGSGEISRVIETQYGYHIIKCISTFNREVTDENKISIVEKRRQEAFNSEYEEFVQTLTRDINTRLWEELRFIHGENIHTSDFFEIYDNI